MQEEISCNGFAFCAIPTSRFGIPAFAGTSCLASMGRECLFHCMYFPLFLFSPWQLVLAFPAAASTSCMPSHSREVLFVVCIFSRYYLFTKQSKIMKVKMFLIYLAAMLLSVSVVHAQKNVGIGTATPQGALDVSSTTGCFIPPRMTTTQRDDLVSPPTGALIFNTTLTQYQNNTGTPSAPFWSAWATVATTVNSCMIRTRISEMSNIHPSKMSDVPPVLSVIPCTDQLFDNTGGYVTYNADGSYTLKKGKIYKLEFSAGFIRGSSTTDTYARFQWYNVTTGNYLGATQHQEFVTSGSVIGTASSAAIAVLDNTSAIADVIVSPLYKSGDTISEFGDAEAGTNFPIVVITIMN